MKQALVEGAVRLPGLNLYEQGAGKLSVVGSKAVLEAYHPRASLVPPTLNFTGEPFVPATAASRRCACSAAARLPAWRCSTRYHSLPPAWFAVTGKGL